MRNPLPYEIIPHTKMESLVKTALGSSLFVGLYHRAEGPLRGQMSVFNGLYMRRTQYHK